MAKESSRMTFSISFKKDDEETSLYERILAEAEKTGCDRSTIVKNYISKGSFVYIEEGHEILLCLREIFNLLKVNKYDDSDCNRLYDLSDDIAKVICNLYEKYDMKELDDDGNSQNGKLC